MSSRPTRERKPTKRLIDEEVPEPTTKRAKKGAKKPKKAKDPNAPKKALTAYFHFMSEVRAEVKEDNPEATIGEISKIIGAQWQEMSKADKKPYKAMESKDKARYTREMKAYKPED